ncbi:carotenoid 1,2-hydratase [Caldichromatium japonicum]
MTERGRSALTRDPTHLVIGPSQLRWEGDTLVIKIDERAAPIPSRLKGQVRVYPHGVNARDFTLDPAGRHLWRPLAPLARVEVAFSHPGIHWQGSGYLDSNRGAEPLERAFQGWDWSRAGLHQEAMILYDTRARAGEGAQLALRFTAQGEIDEMQLPPRAPLPKTPVWRIARRTHCDPGERPRVLETLEDTPFYARSVVRTRLLGRDAQMVHESLCLDRFSQPWVKSLLPFRMPRSTR